MAELFGWEVKKKKEAAKVQSFVAPSDDEGTLDIAGGAGLFGQYLSYDKATRNEFDLIRKYRTTAENPECDQAIEDIIFGRIPAPGMREVMDIDRKGRKKPESKSNLTKVNEASQEESVATYIQDYYRNPKTGESMISDEMVEEFYKTHPEWEDQADGTKEGMEAVLDNFNEFFEINYGIMFDDSKDIDENLKTHFKRFM